MRRPYPLVLFLILAGLLRFVGLSWGLRHAPDWDEKAFVVNTWDMVGHRDLDHGFYEYPGLFSYLLAVVFIPLHTDGPPGPAAYLAARGLVAAAGVVSVGLVYLLGARVLSPRTGLFAALLLAVSPIEVDAAHMVRPDVVLEAFVLLALLAFRRVGPAVRGDVVAGLALGAATAVKFTGAFLVPSYLAARWLSPGPRVRRVLLAGLLSAAVLLAFTPYAVLHYHSYASGLRTQWLAHYNGRTVAPHFFAFALYYVQCAIKGLGPLGAALLVAGTWLSGWEWRSRLFLLLHPLTTILVLSTADLRFSRHLVPTSGVLALLAAFALERVSRIERWGPRGAWLLAVVAALFPLASSLGYLRSSLRPNTWDRTLDWVTSNVPAGSRILSAVPDLGLDRARYEVLPATGAPELDRLLAAHADYVVIGAWGEDLAGGWTPARVMEHDDPAGGPRTALFAVPASARPSYRDVALEAAWLRSSSNPQALSALVDGRAETSWQTSGPQRPGDFVEVGLPQPVRLGRIDLILAYRPLQSALRYARGLSLSVTEDGSTWQPVRTADGRAPVEEQLRGGREPSQVLLLLPRVVRGVRIIQTGRNEKKWAFATLRLQAVSAP